ncbi:hypothetical protein GGI43DRAFT_396031 [Trichoderma evansii]
MCVCMCIYIALSSALEGSFEYMYNSCCTGIHSGAETIFLRSPIDLSYAVFDYLTLPSPVSWQGVEDQLSYGQISSSAGHRVSRVRLGCGLGGLYGCAFNPRNVSTYVS